MFENEITAVILAGGLGTRLRSVVSDKPKALAEVGNRPFIFYLLDQIEQIRVQNVVLCIGYQGDKIKSALGSRYGALRISYSEETVPLGTAGALRQAMPLFQSETILVMNGDSYCNINFSDFCSWHYSKKALASISVRSEKDVGGLGCVEIDGNGAVTQFLEKCQSGRPGYVNAGIYLFSTVLLQEVPENKEISLEYNILPSWVGHGFYGYMFEGRCLDIGTPENYARAEEFFALKESREC